MRVGKAKRRHMRWLRYIQKTQSESGHVNAAGYHTGMVIAHDNAMKAHRWAPIGFREVPIPMWGFKRRDW
jgi:hypothetical protein